MSHYNSRRSHISTFNSYLCFSPNCYTDSPVNISLRTRSMANGQDPIFQLLAPGPRHITEYLAKVFEQLDQNNKIQPEESMEESHE